MCQRRLCAASLSGCWLGLPGAQRLLRLRPRLPFLEPLRLLLLFFPLFFFFFFLLLLFFLPPERADLLPPRRLRPRPRDRFLMERFLDRCLRTVTCSSSSSAIPRRRCFLLAPSSSRPRENLDFPNLAILPSRMPLAKAFLIWELTSFPGRCAGDVAVKYFLRELKDDPLTSLRFSNASNTESTVIRFASALPVPDDESDAILAQRKEGLGAPASARSPYWFVRTSEKDTTSRARGQTLVRNFFFFYLCDNFSLSHSF